MNIYIERIMRVNNQVWSALTIFGGKDHRNIFIAHIENFMLGCEHNTDNSIIYFDRKSIDKVDTMLNKSEYINDWHWSDIQEENWNIKCEEFFKPIVIDEKVEVIPYWEKSKSEYLDIRINPALAFGTGHHETTYMMIQAMLDFDFNRKTVFDIGTGSGILSILAEKIGAKSIFAIDNDQLTYNNFYENLELNHINNKIEFRIEDCFNIDNFNYDFIFANINLNILLDLIPLINNKGTILILSGILSRDESKILKILDSKNIKNKYRKKEWLCLVVEL